MPRSASVERNIVFSIGLALGAAIAVGWCAAPGDLPHTADGAATIPAARMP